MAHLCGEFNEEFGAFLNSFCSRRVDESSSLKNLGISDVCLATLASEGGSEIHDPDMATRESLRDTRIVDKISLQPLVTSIEEFLSVAKAVEELKEGQIHRQLIEQESRGDFVDLKLRALNDRLMFAERGFLDADGLRGRKWFKHLIYGPSGDYESKLYNAQVAFLNQ